MGALKLKACCSVPMRKKLREGYEISPGRITANVGTDKIWELMQGFIEEHDEPLFFILEIPAKAGDEPGDGSSLHKDVYYIDGLTREQAKTVLFRAGKLLINDGMSEFGFGGHESSEEITFGKYNVLTVFAEDAERYRGFFEAYRIPEAHPLITAWDTFSEFAPGSCSLYEENGRTVYDLPEELNEFGIYFAERRED